jgi:hypothetical protein
MNQSFGIMSERNNQFVSGAGNQVSVINSGLYTNMNHGVIPLDPNPLAADYDFGKAIYTTANRMATFAKRIGLP